VIVLGSGVVRTKNMGAIFFVCALVQIVLANRNHDLVAAKVLHYHKVETPLPDLLVIVVVGSVRSGGAPEADMPDNPTPTVQRDRSFVGKRIYY